MEDCQDDAELVVASLTAAGYVVDWRRVETRDAFLTEIETNRVDLVLADYSLPAFDGLSALRLVRERHLDVPFIFVSGVMGEERAVESLKAGATDYVLKTNLSRLVPVVERALKEGDEQRRRRSAESATARALDDLRKANQLKSEFLATMSHELRTPLNHIIGFNDILLEEPEQLTTEQLDILQTVRRSAHDLLALVNGILDVQRLEAGTAHAAPPAATDVGEMLSQLTTTTAGLTADRDLRLTCEVPAQLPTIHIDRAKLEKVLQNLIDNAVKFTPHGRISIGAEPQDDGLLFTVRDSGAGIPRDVLPIIFEPFRQGDGTLARLHGGVGLGLYIARREIDLLGGRVTVESEVGRGSTFRVWVPREPRCGSRPAASWIPDAPDPYADILDAISDLVQTATAEGRFLYANRAWLVALGYAGDELRRLSIDDVVHPQSRADLHRALQRALAGNPVQGLLARFITKDGRTLDLEGSIQGRVANDGTPFALCSYQNVTERTAAERGAEARRRLLEAVLESIPVGVFFTDASGRITHANSAARQIWGGVRYVGIEEYDQYKGWSVSSGKPIAAEEWPAARAVREGAATVDELVEIECFDGARKVILNSATPLRDEQGVVSGVVIVNHDVTVAERARELVALNERLRLITDNLSDMVSQVSIEGVFEYVSRAHERVLGHAPEQMLGKSVLDFLHPDDVDGVRRLIAAAIASRSRGHAEFRYRHADGHYVWLATDGELLFDEHGAPVGAVLNGRDITERKAAEEALRQSEERLSRAFEFAAIGMALVAPDGRWLKVNRALCEIVGHRAEEVQQRTLQDITYPDDLEADLACVRRMLAGELDTYQIEKRCFHKSGRVLWVLQSVCLVRDERGQPLHFVLQIQDIDARNKAEADILHLNAELERRVRERTAQVEAADKELEVFSYSVSHDLRAPLRAVDGFARMLVEDHAGRVSPAGAHCVERVRAGVRRMGQLLDDLLVLSRVQRAELNCRRVDLSAQARTIVADLQRAAPQRTVDFVIADAVVAHGDATLLRVLLENLLGNAWKYTGKHSTARIEFGVTEDRGVPIHFVRDDGAGFDITCADKLFGVFQRLHGTSDFEGTGVGLAIVQRIIRRHGGRVWAEAGVERGATFYFTLPPAGGADE